MKKVIAAENAPKPIDACSPAIKANGFVFVSGQAGADPATEGLVEGNDAAQTVQALRNMEDILAAAGLTMADVVKAAVFLADIQELAAVNEAYKQVFCADCPARSAFQVANLPGRAQVEIEAIAARQERWRRMYLNKGYPHYIDICQCLWAVNLEGGEAKIPMKEFIYSNESRCA